MSRRKNSFSKALGHLKSTKIDEKLEVLNEVPTNSTSGLYTIVPGAITRTDNLGKIPDHSTIDWDIDGGDGKDTTGLFDGAGNHKFISPPGDNSYILGPMSSMYYTYASPSTWTRIGYIRASDRRMVNLGTITGSLADWDGTSTDFSSYGQLTLEQAQWFKNTAKRENYRAFYPGPPSSTPDAFGRYYCTITGTPIAEKDNLVSKAPIDLQSSDIMSAILDRLNKGKKLSNQEKKWLEDNSVNDEALKSFNKWAGGESKAEKLMNGLISALGKITNLESAANLLNMYDDFLKNPPPDGQRLDATSQFSARDLNKLQSVRNQKNINFAINKAIEIANDPNRANKLVKSQNKTLGDLQWEVAGDQVTAYLQKMAHSTGGLDNSLHNNVQIDREAFRNSGGKDIIIIKDYQFRPGGSVAGAEDTALGKALQKGGVELDSVGSGNPLVMIGAVVAAKTGITGANQHGGLYKSPPMKYKVVVPTNSVKGNSYNPRNVTRFKTLGMDYAPEGRVLSESRRSRILKTLKDPVVIPETKQKSYKVSPGRRYKKDKTNFQGMEKLVGDTKPQESFKEPQDLWSDGWQGHNARISQDKKNIVLEKIGEGKQAWDYMLNHGTVMNAKQLEEFWGKNPDFYSYVFGGKKYRPIRKEQVKGDYIVFLVDEAGKNSSMLQSELNMKLAEDDEKKMLAEYNKLNKFEPISYEKDPLFKKVSKTLKSKIDYPEKPAVKGYPNEPPPKLGPDGFHPDFGKKYKYDKLDPVSAIAMRNAPTGDPEIDANVEKASKKLKVKVKEEYSDWKQELKEKEELKEWSPVASTRPTNSTAQTFQHASGAKVTLGGIGGSDNHPTEVTITADGESFPVAAPTYGQLPIAGIPMPVSAVDPMVRHRQKQTAKEINKRLDASEEVAKKAKADALMKARLSISEEAGVIATNASLAQYEADKKKYDEALEKHNKEVEKVREANYQSRTARNEKVLSTLKKYKVSPSDGLGATGGVDYKLVDNPKKGGDRLLLVISGDNGIGFEYSDRVNIRIYKPEEGKQINIKKIQSREVSGTFGGKYIKTTGKRRVDTAIEYIGAMAEDIDIHDFPQKEPAFDMKRPLKPATVNLIPSGNFINKLKTPIVNKAISILSLSLQAPAKQFLGYLSNTLPKTQDNSFFGEKAAQDAFYNVQLEGTTRSYTPAQGYKISGTRIASTGSGKYGMLSVLGSTQPKNLTVDLSGWTSTGEPQFEVNMGYEYDFKPNHVEWVDAVKEGRYDDLSSAIEGLIDTLPGAVPSPVRSSMIKVLVATFQMSVVDSLLGGWHGADSKIPLTGWAVGISKLLGRGKATSGKVSMPFHEIDKTKMDSDLYDFIEQQYWDRMTEMEMVSPGSRPSTVPGSQPAPGPQSIPGPSTPPGSKPVPGPSKPDEPKSFPLGLDATTSAILAGKKKKKKVNEDTFDTVKKLRKQWEYDGKPSPDGFPDNPPPKLKDGWHPEYGNKDSSYNRLDPESAKAMPKTGNKKIDAKVEKAKKKKK